MSFKMNNSTGEILYNDQEYSSSKVNPNIISQSVPNTNSASLVLTYGDQQSRTVTIAGLDGIQLSVPDSSHINIASTMKYVILENSLTGIGLSESRTVFSIPSIPQGSFVDVSGILLYKFSSGAANKLNISVSPTGANIGGTGLGFTVHKTETTISSVRIDSTIGSSEISSLDNSLGVIRFSGIVRYGGAGSSNFDFILTNNNTDLGMPTLSILAKTFVKYNYLL